MWNGDIACKSGLFLQKPYKILKHYKTLTGFTNNYGEGKFVKDVRVYGETCTG